MSRLGRLWWPVLLGALTALWWRAQPLSSPDTAVTAELSIAAPVTGEAWLRFNTGHGWSFAETRAFWVTQSVQPRTYRVALPPGDYQLFAVWWAVTGKVIPVAEGRLVDAEGQTIAALREQPASPVAPPTLIADQAVRISGPDQRSWAETAGEFLLASALFGLLGFFFERRAPGLKIRMFATGRRLSSWLAAHPRTALAAAALFGVVLSCHPVIFAGRSFVSPNNGALCLYDRHPTLPGAPAAPIEQWSSSDVYATLWAHLPYSVVTHRAVLRDGEWPLWNRYTHCGATLLGQGQSMPGDPLFWIPVFAKGSAWSWDVRFLLSKMWFAFGVGLLVWRTARHLPSALLLAASASFLDFFSYRFNHPAFFSVCYAPWILLCWLSAVRAATPREALGWSLALVGANWCELNSGTAKESAMLLLGLNLVGLLTLFFTTGVVRWRRLALLALSGAVFAALSAPLWVVFLDALARGYTPYDTPQSSQLPAGLLLGLFDDLFYRQVMSNEWHVAPALNFLVLIGVLWAVVEPRRLLEEPTVRAASLITLPLLALVFGVIPPGWINRWPLVRNIAHVDNTFTCVLIVPLLVIAGFGIRVGWEKIREPGWSRHWRATLLILGILVALYLGTVQAMPRLENFALRPVRSTSFSPFFIGYAGALLATCALLPWCARRVALRAPTGLAICGLMGGLIALHFRQGMWLDTKFDSYVMNPQPRVDLRAASPAVDALLARPAEPSRVVGFGKILRPGFNVLPGLESPYGADAVAGRRYAEWLDAVGLGAATMWVPQIDRPVPLAALNAMNVRYYLTAPEDSANAAAGLVSRGVRDLEIRESPAAWPRAFFTDRLQRYSDPALLGGWVRQGDGRPFAALEEGQAGIPALPSQQTGREIVAARDYRLTSNSTTFTVSAPRPGLAVLIEAFPAEDVQAMLDGQPAPVLRVNHAFVGVALPSAGEHRITMRYWPRYLSLALCGAVVGLIALIVGIFVFCFGARPAISPSAHA